MTIHTRQIPPIPHYGGNCLHSLAVNTLHPERCVACKGGVWSMEVYIDFPEKKKKHWWSRK